MPPELIEIYRAAFMPPIPLLGSSFIPGMVLLVILLWVIRRQENREGSYREE